MDIKNTSICFSRAVSLDRPAAYIIFYVAGQPCVGTYRLDTSPHGVKCTELMTLEATQKVHGYVKRLAPNPDAAK